MIALSVPYPEHGDKPWVAFIEDILGSDFYYVHFNRHPAAPLELARARTPSASPS